MDAPRTARARARAELTTAIADAARTQLAEQGASALSLRAVARELGMASSAVYRYVASRDELLTMLIVEAYDALGAAAEDGERTAREAGGGPGTRWLGAARGFRAWARAHPHEYALVYGSPVPGYAAPAATVAPAVRTARVLIAILRDAVDAGQLEAPRAPLGRSVVAAPVLELSGGLPPTPFEDLPERALVLLSSLTGLVTYELFGHLVNTVSDVDTWFDASVAWVASVAGLVVEVEAS
ncbi:AcrR family transcriptional regulator [Motilibacter peucedani]|uniref:AcrR family transcriptional regulator n=1 Tax=Motilibacter peucedani TaxID=598650 RepID=A0A420XRL2_9ACTN|nr:TetR/AcrR family transcriptional regulator [Motilibacter peucedani]RKS77525.1 AcrR family transcriptional regulator [Motilibacter peucedani]